MKQDKEILRELADRYTLTGKDFFKHPTQGFVIITRAGVEKIMAHDKIQVTYEVVPELTENQENCCIKATAQRVDENGEVYTVESFGTANHYNCSIKTTRNGKTLPHYPVETAEKRAKARAVLQITGWYSENVMSEDEAEDFKRQ
tara:strand:- start:1006 stop:1440 length:435 start_codon:yes stop_codon:yes gene_type:complete